MFKTMETRFWSLFGLACLLMPQWIRAANPPVSLESLLDEMVSRESLARWPSPAYRALETTSHDRSKTNPADAATWHSNKDYENFIRIEANAGRKEWVIMEHDGAGAITRIWLPLEPSRDKQIIRFYLDGSPTPAIEANFNDLLSGRGFVKPPLAYVAWDETDLGHQIDTLPKTMRGVGGDLYLPIPYAKGCKITLDQIPFYYHIQYRHYEPGTEVKSFSMAGFEAAKETIEKVTQRLMADPQVAPHAPNKEQTLAAGEELSIDLPKGSAAVREIQVHLDQKDAARSRSVVIAATFDGEADIWCPLSEFFGAGPRLRPVHDWFRTVTEDQTLTARWIMPYERSAHVAIKNVGDQPVVVKLVASIEPWRWDERSMHFHATWRCQLGIPTRPISDWNFLEATGQGVYVGDTLSVFSPAGGWYGEGDERIYVDGETFPSHLGTGTEDYYGYAWGMADYFSSPSMSMPRRDITDRNNWRAYTTTSRMRLLDGIPFVKAFHHDMEIWDWDDTHVDYAVGNFWYARPGSRSNRQPQPTEAAAPLHEAPPDPRTKFAGAIECESMRVVDHSPGLAFEKQEVTGISDGHWSGGEQLFVRASKTGDFVTLEIPVEGNQPRKLILHGTKSYDYGIIRFGVNGKPSGADFDGYLPQPRNSGPIDLGTVEPKDGKLLLRVEVVGSNPESKGPRYYFGLDCVVLSNP